MRGSDAKSFGSGNSGRRFRKFPPQPQSRTDPAFIAPTTIQDLRRIVRPLDCVNE